MQITGVRLYMFLIGLARKSRQARCKMTVRAFEKELVNEYDKGHKNMA